MLVKLQILFTILSAICIAAFIPVGSLLDWPYAILCGLLAALFFGLMLLCKQAVAKKEEEKAQAEKQTDEEDK